MTKDLPGGVVAFERLLKEGLAGRLWPEPVLRLVELLAAGRAAEVGEALRTSLAELVRRAEEACGIDVTYGPPEAQELAAVAYYMNEVLGETLPTQVDDLAETLAVAGVPDKCAKAIAAEWGSRVEIAVAHAFAAGVLASQLAGAPLLPDLDRGQKILAGARDGGRVRSDGKKGKDVFQAAVNAARAEDDEISTRGLFRRVSDRLKRVEPEELQKWLVDYGLKPRRANELAKWWCSQTEKKCAARTIRRRCKDPGCPHPRKN